MGDISPDVWAKFRDLMTPRTSPFPTPGSLAAVLDPATVQTPALELIDSALVDIAEKRCKRLLISISPQEGKSERVSRAFTLWTLMRSPDTRIAIASYEHSKARRWGRTVRNDIQQHPEFGLRVQADSAAAHAWHLDGHNGGVICVGVGGALTGAPVDLMIIDDPHAGHQAADSAVQRENVWDWWTGTVRTRFSPDTPVVIIQTRWHEDDLSGRLIRESPETWTVINIPAKADHRPELGEVDPLGRSPGEMLVSTRGRHLLREVGTCKKHPDTPCCDWDDIEKDVGSRTWAALYQGRPAPGEGLIFRRTWWKRYEIPLWVEDDGVCHGLGFDEVLQSWDMAFKDTNTSDYVVGQVWGRRGDNAFLLDQVRGRFSFVDTCMKLRALSVKWPQSTAKLVEDKANGTAVISQLSNTVSGLIPVQPDGTKVARASAISPFVEAGNVHLPVPEIRAWVEDVIEEAAAFPLSTHDDQVDALSQALNRLLLSNVRPRVRWLG